MPNFQARQARDTRQSRFPAAFHSCWPRFGTTPEYHKNRFIILHCNGALGQAILG
jgi:hypothetical protein